MLSLYRIISENLNQAISTNGEAATKQPLFRGLRSVRKVILSLLSSWISRTVDRSMVSFPSRYFQSPGYD